MCFWMSVCVSMRLSTASGALCEDLTEVRWGEKSSTSVRWDVVCSMGSCTNNIYIYVKGNKIK